MSQSRVFLNGCWDLPHAGHYNAIRQARSKPGCDFLVVGIHSNDEIRRVKGGAFIMNEDEKETMLRACKYVDDVVHGIPYRAIDLALLDREDVRCGFAAHGDDPIVLPDGTGMYDEAKLHSRYFEFRRSEGVSTTLVLERLLASTAPRDETPLSPGSERPHQGLAFTMSRLELFANTSMDDAKKVVYIDGEFDLLNPGHITILERASALGDYLFVGIFPAEVSKELWGDARPIFTVGERCLQLLACKYVGDVLLDAQGTPSEHFLRSYGVQTVVSVRGHVDFRHPSGANRFRECEPFARVVELDCSDVSFSTRTLMDRVIANRGGFVSRNEKKREPNMKVVDNTALLA